MGLRIQGSRVRGLGVSGFGGVSVVDSCDGGDHAAASPVPLLAGLGPGGLRRGRVRAEHAAARGKTSELLALVCDTVKPPTGRGFFRALCTVAERIGFTRESGNFEHSQHPQDADFM